MGPHHPFAPVPPRREFVQGLTSLPESNSAVVSLNLHDWCFRVARQAPSLAESSASQRVPTTRSQSSLKGRRGPWEKEEGTGSEGARLESADVGVGRLLAGPDRWSEQHRGGRGGGPQGTGPSAALGSVAPEEARRGARRCPKRFLRPHFRSACGIVAGRLPSPRTYVAFEKKIAKMRALLCTRRTPLLRWLRLRAKVA